MAEFPQIKVTHNIGNTIEIPNQVDVRASTYLSSNIGFLATSLPVDNATDFTNGTAHILVSTIGSENSEIVLSSGQSIQAIAVSSTRVLHNRGDIVQEINFDQVSVFSSPTIDGAYTLVGTSTFQVTQQNTIIFHAAGTATTFYKIQWKNSVTSAVSDFSDPISVSTYDPKSVAQTIFCP